MTVDEVRRARAYLSRVVQPPVSAELAALIADEGAVGAARLVAGGHTPFRSSGPGLVERAEADLAAIAALGGRLVIPGDDEWPTEAFVCFGSPDAVHDPRWAEPIALWVLGAGRLEELTTRAVAMTGARAATGYGEHVAADVGYGLAEAGLTVITGGGFGIDAAAHRGALAVEDGRTIAVQARGLDAAYPSGHDRLFRQVAARGVLLSEYPPGVRPSRERFLVRHRLIAALTAGTVMVEAGVRSGARRTVAAAAALGKPVMAVPGPVTSALSAGSHLEIRERRAVLVTSARDVIEQIGDGKR
ncbi:MAG: DNA-processing protein DprA [Pseudonocardiaceae bacterium]